MVDINDVLKWYDANYEICASYILNDEKKIYLGDKTNKICRFCGRDKNAGATFKKEAHALSHLISNNRLFSYYECDDCNQKYAKYENDYAAFMKLYHCILQVSGKNGIPSFKVRKSRIDAQDANIDIKVFEDDDSLVAEIDEVNNKLILKGLRSYTPLYVYKALLKMALTIVPNDDANHLTKAMTFLKSDYLPKLKLPVLFQIFGGRRKNVYRYVTTIMFRRKAESVENIPSYWYVLAYNNICIQMPIFGSDFDEKINGATMNFIPFPTPPEISGTPIIRNGWVDLSSAIQEKKEINSITLQFEDMESIDLTEDLENDSTK